MRRQGISKVFVACPRASVTSVHRKEHNKNPASSTWLATQWRVRDPDAWCWRLFLLWLPSQAASGSRGAHECRVPAAGKAKSLGPDLLTTKTCEQCARRRRPVPFKAVGCSAQRTLLWKLVVSSICCVNVGQSRHLKWRFGL